MGGKAYVIVNMSRTIPIGHLSDSCDLKNRKVRKGYRITYVYTLSFMVKKYTNKHKLIQSKTSNFP